MFLIEVTMLRTTLLIIVYQLNHGLKFGGGRSCRRIETESSLQRQTREALTTLYLKFLRVFETVIKVK